MLIDVERATLLVVDIQDRLLPAVRDPDTLLARVDWLLRAAETVGLPTVFTEQYPQGLGGTAPVIDALIQPTEKIEKIHFSAVAEGNLLSQPAAQRKQWVVCGTESHVCVQQTVLDLLAAGREVAVVEEAVGSRQARDKTLALERMRQHGAQIVSREMVAFEWLHQANTPEFRALLKGFIR